MATGYTTDPIKVIDVDSHYSPPPGFWEAHAPAKFKERVPRIGEDEQGEVYLSDAFGRIFWIAK